MTLCLPPLILSLILLSPSRFILTCSYSKEPNSILDTLLNCWQAITPPTTTTILSVFECCMCLCTFLCHSGHVEVTEQLMTIHLLLLLAGFWIWNSGHLGGKDLYVMTSQTGLNVLILILIWSVVNVIIADHWERAQIWGVHSKFSNFKRCI